MVRTRQRCVFSFFLIFLLFFSIGGEVCARGQQEDRLDEARSLIEENRYNDAILLLTQVMKENPRKFDEAERLMKDVREARALYNQTYQELLEILDVQEGETLNEQEAYDIIQRLEELDADPNKAAVEAFAQARQSIIFTVNNQRFQGIMERADQLLEQERYVEAVAEYLTGFSLHEELFLEEEYGQVIENQIDARRDEIRQLANQFETRYEVFNEVRREFETTSAADENTSQAEEQPPGSFSDIPERELLLGQQSSMSELWSGIVQNANAIENIRLSILGEDTTDIPFLSTLRVLSRGRTQSEAPIGIAGAVERPLVESMQSINDWLRSTMRNTFEEALQRFNEGQFDQLEQPLFNGTLDAVEAVTPSIDQWERLHALRRELEVSRKLGPTQVETQSDRLFVRAIEYAAVNYNQLIERIVQLNQLETGGILTEQATEIRTAREELVVLLGNLQTSLEEIQGTLSEYNDYKREGVTVARSLEVLEVLQADVNTEIARSRTIEGSFVERIAELRYTPAVESVQSAEDEVSQAQDFVDGVDQEIQEGGEEVEVRFPNRSIDLVNSAQESVNSARTTVEAVLAELDTEKEYIQEQQAIVSLQEQGRSLLSRIETIERQRSEVLTAAADLNRRANLAVSEGDIRLQQTRAEIEKERYELAREKLEQAGDAYSQSLAYREDPEVRSIIDEEIPELADQILFEQNQAIVREVRSLINRGRELFFQEKFVEAEQVLNRAQSRWRQTHPEDDPEINLWLDRVERALEATSGITIEETDPLYTDMMQILNLAKEEFQRGRRLYEQGRRSAAMEAFEAAEKNIQYIKEPFPNNQASGVLYLRILQYTEPEDFESLFRSRFRQARAKIDTAPEEAYRELQVLREIEPDYSGLDDAIYRAEIATGIRQPSPDPQKLARARDLFQQAQKIVEGDIRAQFPVALTYLNEAINLDPDYQEAILLKDRIQTGQGGQVSVVLSSVDQQKLRQAENLFIDGRYFEASVIVNQLWQNSENRSNPKLVELRRRIENQL
ncbi:MAG: hypothetical protein ACOCW5_00535 [Spirochaetia bacterium]